MQIQWASSYVYIVANKGEEITEEWWRDPNIQLMTRLNEDTGACFVMRRRPEPASVREWVNPATFATELRYLHGWDYTTAYKGHMTYDILYLPLDGHVYTPREQEMMNNK
jgi:hypothetical protein